MALWRILNDFFARHRIAYLGAIICLFGVGLLNLALPWWIGNTIDALRANEITREVLFNRIGLLIAVGVGMYVLRYLWRVQLFGTSYKLGIELRDRYYAKLTRLDPGFFQSHRSGDLLARASQDIDAVETAAGEGVLSSIDGAMTLFLVLGVMIIGIDAPLALFALVPFPFMAWGFYRVAKRVQHDFGQSLQRFSQLNDRTQEALGGLRMLRQHSLVEAEIADFEKRAEAAAQADFEVQRMEARYDPVVFLALGAATLLTLSVGTWRYLDQAITLGQLTSFTLYLVQLIWPMFALGWCLNILQRGEAAARRLDDFFTEHEIIADHGTRQHVDNSDIAFEVQAFTYPQSTTATLEHINIIVPAGQTLGIVGTTGSGKSTLIRLLLRQYALAQGEIRLGGHAIGEYTLTALRTAFAYVPQDPFLFAATLGENVALARPQASRDEILQALEDAAFSTDLAELPQGLETQIGERGITLSGGQRQRVALARALLSNAPILLLDDTLSAVDYATEQRLLTTLSKQRARTCLIVSHRLSAVAQADRIVVLEEGQAIESGDHASLLAMKGHYAGLWQHQQLMASQYQNGLSDDAFISQFDEENRHA
ncbi:ABC transporter ATP-binding protein [Phytohalomonas tamaricis]|uniref:ABC transporter ATP-binding protein n=1 Tax=Phytohalomonas tamaricis TaxID=2081032 RepID=UPI000D0B13A7|nr:ABC transporter transmembrane domain-containing protein [Phytohalomonas tamaricis]